MIFLGLFIFFVCMFAYLRHKSTAAEEAAAESFWNRENEANHTRRKDISGLPYITIPLADFPMGIYDNPELKKYEETLQSLAGQKILNLGGKTNTDLKLEYGVANLETLCACDENYTTLCRIVLPIMKPGIATVALLTALGYWNEWFLCMLYVTEKKL